MVSISPISITSVKTFCIKNSYKDNLRLKPKGTIPLATWHFARHCKAMSWPSPCDAGADRSLTEIPRRATTVPIMAVVMADIAGNKTFVYIWHSKWWCCMSGLARRACWVDKHCSMHFSLVSGFSVHMYESTISVGLISMEKCVWIARWTVG